MRLSLFAFLFTLAGMTGASIAAASSPPPSDLSAARKLRVDRAELIGSSPWALESARGPEQDRLDALFAPGLALALRFGPGEVSVEGGCNAMRGPYDFGGRHMEFQVAITTRMSCGDEPDRADQSISALLSAGYTVEIRETRPWRLRLIGDEGTELVFVAGAMP